MQMLVSFCNISGCHASMQSICRSSTVDSSLPFRRAVPEPDNRDSTKVQTGFQSKKAHAFNWSRKPQPALNAVFYFLASESMAGLIFETEHKPLKFPRSGLSKPIRTLTRQYALDAVWGSRWMLTNYQLPKQVFRGYVHPCEIRVRKWCVGSRLTAKGLRPLESALSQMTDRVANKEWSSSPLPWWSRHFWSRIIFSEDHKLRGGGVPESAEGPGANPHALPLVFASWAQQNGVEKGNPTIRVFPIYHAISYLFFLFFFFFCFFFFFI